MKYACVLAVAIALLGQPLFGATVTVDPQQQFQTIDGFGGFGPMAPWYEKRTTWYNDQFIDELINNLGTSMIRDQIPANFEQTNENGDANNMDLSKYNLTVRYDKTNAPIAQHVPFWKAAKAEADRKGRELRFITSVWSPPAWMKTNNNIKDGGNLKPSAYEEYAEYLAAYIKIMKRETGIDLYGISIQNEPAFVEYYNSCVYSGTQLRDMIKTAGRRFEKEGIQTKIFLPEDVTSAYQRIRGYVEATCSDPEGRKYSSVVACHGYGSDGVTANSPAANLWNALKNLAGKYDMDLWMTETSGYPSTWAGGLSIAKGLFGALVYGDLSAWVMWYTRGNLMTSNAVDARGYAVAPFYRYVRPGAVRIGCDSDDPAVLCVAFAHPTKKTLTIVLINDASGTKSVSLKGPEVPGSLAAYRSSASEKCTSLGSTSTASISLPGSSVTALVATNFTVPIVAVGRVLSAALPAGQRKHGRQPALYSLDGRCAGGASATRAGLRPGIYVRSEQNQRLHTLGTVWVESGHQPQ